MIRKISLCALILLCTLCSAFSQAAAPTSPKVVCASGYLGTPIEHGRRDLVAALSSLPGAGRDITVYVCLPGEMHGAAVRAAAKALPKKPESFAIARVGREIAIVGRDRTGAMYGCFELAERIGLTGTKALSIRKPIAQAPAVEFRAINPFLTLPYKETDKDWYFLQDDYWTGYLDLLARSRINWIDLHGMYDIRTTIFPNIYPYFITSEKFPAAGVEPAVAHRNLAVLKKVMRMAKERGIKFAMMSYSASWDGAGLRKSPYPGTDDNLAVYTREVVRKMIEECADLEMIGFRIGESGKKESFYRDSYIPAVEEAGRKVGLYTRTWGGNKPAIMEIGKLFPHRFFIEIKYNGEQLGPPYITAGGRMTGWRDYSYQDYYTPPTTYRIIYQLRANGTLRVFPWGNPERAARANEDSLLAGSIGLCVEPIDSYYPKYDYRHADNSPNRWFRWQWQRDWFWYATWGRTAYDPSLGKRDDLWVRMFESRLGKAGSDLYNAMKWASMIPQDAYTAYALGPDHRQQAIELEWGGSVANWAKGSPFDVQNVQSPREYAERLIKGEFSAKATPITMAGYLDEEARMTRHYLDLANGRVSEPSAEYNDLVTELTALSHLGDYYSHKTIATALYEVMRQSNDISGGENAGADRIREELQLARQSWNELAAIGTKHYKPFVDWLRMKTERYTWAEEGKKLNGDIRALDDEIAAIKASGKTGSAPDVRIRGDGKGPELSGARSTLVTIDEATKKLVVKVKATDPRGVENVSLKFKLMPSQTDWYEKTMTLKDGVYVGEALVPNDGMLWCLTALDADGNGTMWPDFRKETPYKVVPPWLDTRPRLQPEAALKAIENARPKLSQFSAMIVGHNAATLDAASAEAKSTLIDFVKGGLSLIILDQEDPRIWHPEWLGGGIRYTDKDSDVASLIGNHPILRGLPRPIKVMRIVNNALEGGDSTWVHLSDPKGIAIRQVGKGWIILVQADLKFLQHGDVLRLVQNVVRFATHGSEKPVLVIDPSDEMVYSALRLVYQRYVPLGVVAAK